MSSNTVDMIMLFSNSNLLIPLFVVNAVSRRLPVTLVRSLSRKSSTSRLEHCPRKKAILAPDLSDSKFFDKSKCFSLKPFLVNA